MAESRRKSKIHNSNSASGDDHEAHVDKAVPKRKWTPEELRSLIDQIGKFASGKGHDRGYKSMRTRIDWSTVHVAGHDEADCREALTRVMKRVRCERTLQEIMDDARSLLERGGLRLVDKSKQVCLCPAKKPSLFLMYRDTVLQKVQQSHPGVAGTELMRIIGKMYKELNEKRRKRLAEEYQKIEEEYKAQIEQARVDNPDFQCPVHFPDKATRRERLTSQGGAHRVGAPKARRPVDIYVAKKTESKADDPRHAELVAKYTRKYEALSDKKKIKWIKLAEQELETVYREAAIAYWQIKPKFKPITDYKRLLTTDERRIVGDLKEKHPYASLYTYFTTRKLRELTDVKGPERLTVAAQMWKELTVGEKKALELEWQRERGDAGTLKSPSKATKRKAQNSDDSDSDDEDDSPKRSGKHARLSVAPTPKSSSNAAIGKSTPNSHQNQNGGGSKLKKIVEHDRDTKPTILSSSESDSEDDDELPKAAPSKAKGKTVQKAANAKAPASKSSGRQPVQRADSSSDLSDDLSD